MRTQYPLYHTTPGSSNKALKVTSELDIPIASSLAMILENKTMGVDLSFYPEISDPRQLREIKKRTRKKRFSV